MNTTPEGTSEPMIVLVATDFSSVSLEAERAAVALAAGHRAVIHLLHVVEPTLDDAGHPVALANLTELVEQQQVLMDEALARVRRHFDGRTASHLAIGNAAQEIASAARSLHADVVVVGPHRRGTLSRWVLGSVSEKVARTAPCAVLVARPREQQEEPVVTIEPPCPDCLAVRASTSQPDAWCQSHTRKPRRDAHRYSELPPSFGLGSMLIRPDH